MAIEPINKELVAVSKLPLTQDTLKQLLHYNPDTGVFTWLGRTAPKNFTGKIAGSLGNNGYLVICIAKKDYGSHRLAFLYMLGRFPLEEVDHIDTIKDNNRWSNLRECTRSQNVQNTKLGLSNSSGVKGVSWHAKTQKWRASIYLEGKSYYVGGFNSIQEAEIAVRKRREELHNTFHNHGTAA